MQRILQTLNPELEESYSDSDLSPSILERVQGIDRTLSRGPHPVLVYMIVPDLMKRLARGGSNKAIFKTYTIVYLDEPIIEKTKIVHFYLPAHIMRQNLGDRRYLLQRGIEIAVDLSRPAVKRAGKTELYWADHADVRPDTTTVQESIRRRQIQESSEFDVYRLAREWYYQIKADRDPNIPDMISGMKAVLPLAQYARQVVQYKASLLNMPGDVIENIMGIILRNLYQIDCEDLENPLLLASAKAEILRMLDDATVVRKLSKLLSDATIERELEESKLDEMEKKRVYDKIIAIKYGIPCPEVSGIQLDLIERYLYKELLRYIDAAEEFGSREKDIKQLASVIVKQEKKKRGFSSQVEKELIDRLLFRHYKLEKFSNIPQLTRIAQKWLEELEEDMTLHNVTDQDVIDYIDRKRTGVPSRDSDLDIIQNKMLCILLGLDC